MADLLMVLDDTGADFKLEAGDLALDETLRTPVLVSLFSDARVEAAEDLDEGETDPRGWWADPFELPGARRFGSLLWTLYRSKVTTDTINAAREFIEVALAWIPAAGIAEDVVVEVTRRDLDGIQARVELVRGTATERADVWDAAAAAVLLFDAPGLQVQLLTA